jgi:hypothetical protein
MTLLALAVILLAQADVTAPADVVVSATFVAPARDGVLASVAVTLTPRDHSVKVNEEPAPRLKLDPAQTVLVDKQRPAPPARSFDPTSARYLDPALPVHFPVAIRRGATRGRQTAKATVTYFYCSQRDGWCRKGTSDVEFPVDVR